MLSAVYNGLYEVFYLQQTEASYLKEKQTFFDFKFFPKLKQLSERKIVFIKIV